MLWKVLFVELISHGNKLALWKPPEKNLLSSGRTRLRLVLDLSIDFFRTKLHVSHGVTGPADDILKSTINAWNASPEKITQYPQYSLDARQGVDRMRTWYSGRCLDSKA